MRVELEPTIGELARRLDHVDATLDHIHKEMISTQLYEAHRETQNAQLEHVHEELANVDRRLDKMAKNIKWALGLVIGLLCTVLAGVVTQALVIKLFG